jgi:hypothetical protein
VKYCLSARQPDSILKKADEIKIELRDFRSIPEYIEKYSDKTLILEFTNNLPEEFNWDDIVRYSDLMGGGFYCALSDLSLVPECSLRNLKFYYKYAVTTLYEIEGLKNIGVSYILIGAPLLFDLKTVSNYKIPIRAVANLAYEPYIKHKNGLIGGWIRPEDVDIYGEYISVLEFYAPKALEKEASLYNVYAIKKTWPGNLNLLIDNLEIDFDNRLLYDEENFARRRMACKQKCLSGKSCRYCIDQFLFPSTVLKKYQDYKNNN